MAAPRLTAAARGVEAELVNAGDPDDAAFLQRFFKTGPGEYGEGDVFLGIRVPVVRRIAKRHAALDLASVRSLLGSQYHEVRLLALIVLVGIYERGDAATKQAVYDLYLGGTARVNNWDLVDASAHRIVGPHLDVLATSPLSDLARAPMVWERRIAIIATLHRIREGRFEDTLEVAELLVGDDHDLIHKATGWMLREVGKRDRETAERFLRRHCCTMPRTMLRYAIEKYPDILRRRYLRGEV